MLPVQVTMRDIPHSPSLETLIRKKAEKLKRYSKYMISCRVVVELSQKHKHQGKLYNVRIDISVPGKELVVTHKQNEDIYIAIRDAFHAAARQIEEHSRRRHGHVKTHSELSHGVVSRMIPEEGFGFIEGLDGYEYYFSTSNMSNTRFDQLSIGDAVNYLAKPLSGGRQAHHVVRERRNHREVA